MKFTELATTAYWTGSIGGGGGGLSPAQLLQINALPKDWKANTPYTEGAHAAFGGKIYRRDATGTSGAAFDPAQWTEAGTAAGGGTRDGGYRGEWNTAAGPDENTGTNDPLTGEALVVGDWWKRTGATVQVGGIDYENGDVIYFTGGDGRGGRNYDRIDADSLSPQPASEALMIALPSSPGQTVLRTDFSPPHVFAQVGQVATDPNSWQDLSAAAAAGDDWQSVTPPHIATCGDRLAPQAGDPITLPDVPDGTACFVLFRDDFGWATDNPLIGVNPNQAQQTIEGLAEIYTFDVDKLEEFLIKLTLTGGNWVKSEIPITVGGIEPEQTFTGADLTGNQITITHGLGKQYPRVHLVDDSGEWTLPARIIYSGSTTEFMMDLTGLNVGTSPWTLTLS